MTAIGQLAMATAAFVGTHLIMSHPLRAPLVRIAGVNGFAILYSLVAFITFGWIYWAWGNVPATPPAYVPGAGIWIAASVIMWLASVLLAGSFIGNPALPAPNATSAALRNPTGVFAITRHPMMWSFALWAIVHGVIWPTPENHVLTAAILTLALVGSAGQDIKKAQVMGDAWRQWCRRTAFFPFAGQFSGRVPIGAAWPGWPALLGGTGLWLVFSWAHTPLGGRMPAGIWHWLG
jgi:uncharacterized membrane protein